MHRKYTAAIFIPGAEVTTSPYGKQQQNLCKKKKLVNAVPGEDGPGVGLGEKDWGRALWTADWLKKDPEPGQSE